MLLGTFNQALAGAFAMIMKRFVVSTSISSADSVPIAGPDTGHAPRPAVAQPWSEGGKTSISNVARLGRAGQSRKDAVEKV